MPARRLSNSLSTGQQIDAEDEADPWHGEPDETDGDYSGLMNGHGWGGGSAVPPDTADDGINNHKSQTASDFMSVNENKKPLFDLGQIVATPGALDALQDAGQTPAEFLSRHIRRRLGRP